jgi:two-component system, NarL family, nitrate/nitrite response regulator NarL
MPRARAKQAFPESVSVLLISRVRLYRDAVIALLNRHPGIHVVGTMALNAETLTELDAAPLDVVLLDMGSPGAVALAASVIKRRPCTRILGFGVDDVAPQVVACAEAGLCGYIPAQASTADLASAIRRVATGETVCSAETAGLLFRHLAEISRKDPSADVDAALTARQREILRLIEQGLSNKEIAQQLALGPSTVKNHVHALLRRLHVGRRGEAAARLSRTPSYFPAALAN